MTLLHNLPPDRLTSSRLWGAVDAETRRLAARSLYDPDGDDAAARAEADVAIAGALRFRHAAVRRLPVEKRVDYLARAVQPDDSLATALFRALHLRQRSAMLGDFLDALAIPQQGGVIDTDETLESPGADALAAAAATLRERYREEEVDLYLAALRCMDPDFWNGLDAVVRTGG